MGKKVFSSPNNLSYEGGNQGSEMLSGLAQGHHTSNYQSQNTHPGFPTPKCKALFLKSSRDSVKTVSSAACNEGHYCQLVNKTKLLAPHPITFSSVFLAYHFTVIIWCSLTEGNRPLQQKLSLDGNPKPIHGTPEGSDGLQWSAEQPCNPSKPKAKTSPVKSNTPAAHLEIKPDELAKKRGKVISFAQMIQPILHTYTHTQKC